MIHLVKLLFVSAKSLLEYTFYKGILYILYYNDLEWKFLNKVTGTKVVNLPSEYNELYIYIRVDGSKNGYVEFTPKKLMLADVSIIFNCGKSSFGDGGKRYNRSATIAISKTTVQLMEAMYSQGANYNEPDINVTGDADLFILYR